MFKEETPYDFLKRELKEIGWKLRNDNEPPLGRFVDALDYACKETSKFDERFLQLPENNKKFFHAFIESEAALIASIFPSPTLEDTKKSIWMSARRADHSINLLNGFVSPYVYTGYLTVASFNRQFVEDYPHRFNKDELERYNEIFSKERIEKIANGVDSFVERYPQSLQEAEYWIWEGTMLKIRSDNLWHIKLRDLSKIFYSQGDEIVSRAKKAKKMFKY